MSKIVLDNVRKSYGGNIEVIKGVSLEIADGEFVVLVGPSGCGKSTLLRMIAGLESITSGTISIGERVVNNVEPAERDIAMVFQNYALYPHMTVRENLAYGLKNRKTPKEEIERRIAKAAKALEIEQFLERKPPASSPVASASASPWAAPSCANRPPSSSMSRFPTSTQSCACRCA
ncbi:sn-glycerol-3-phosphate import ATP-binding protein UgpC [Brucella abortus F6/05-3]|nr:sn-glycerol-3-phosphate import ATP-binding protein ugpC [Brucella abortus bv. 3 str. Tulya]ENS12300.1 sn-glycerol-3-phosphate import ATP-binding protein UgpC [Brucella abortus F1/06-B21]ENS25578.1 sn-glycerol-3-phosphate import ATP-binding protein UgpC [Brucella abortus F6/05-3]